MKMLVAGAVLATLVASPALAQSYGPLHRAEPPNSNSAPHRYNGANPNHGRTAGQANPYTAYGAVTPFGSPGVAQNGANHMSAAREAAVRECNTMAQRYQDGPWGSMKLHQYRACMARHGQME
jgi:hypothetical protein